MKSIILIFYWFSFSWIVFPLFLLAGSHLTGMSTFFSQWRRPYSIWALSILRPRPQRPQNYFLLLVCEYVAVTLLFIFGEEQHTHLRFASHGHRQEQEELWARFAGAQCGFFYLHTLFAVFHTQRNGTLTLLPFFSPLCCGCWRGLLVHGSRCTNSFPSGELISLAKHWSVRWASPPLLVHSNLI